MRGIWLSNLKQATKLRTLLHPQLGLETPVEPDAKAVGQSVQKEIKKTVKRKRIIATIGGTLFLVLIVKLGADCFQAMSYRDHLLSGRRDMENGKMEIAQAEFTLASKADPLAVDPYFYRALAAAQNGDHTQAMKDYDQALRLDPHSVKSLVGRAWVYNRDRKYDEALNDCDAAIKIDPTYVDAYRMRANVYNHLGRYDEAIADSTKYLDSHTGRDSQRADALAKRGYALDEKQNLKDALKDYSEAVACDPNNGNLYASRAVVYMQLRQWQKGLDDASIALQYKPTDAAMFKVRGLCYEGLKMSEEALDDLDILVAHHPTVDTHRVRGEARFNARDYLGSMEDFDYVLLAEPDDKKTQSKYLTAKRKVSSTAPITSAVDDRVAHMRDVTAAELNQPPAVLLKKGYDLMLSGDTTPAIDYLTAAVNALPTDVGARRYLAYALAQGERNEEAVEQFRQLEKMVQLTGNDKLVFARTLTGSGKTQPAIGILQDLIHSDETNDEARIALIKAHLVEHNDAEATELARRGAALSPGLAKAYTRLFEKHDTITPNGLR